MPRTSTIANHPQIKEIIADMISRKTLRSISKRFGVSEDALWYYRKTMEDRKLRVRNAIKSADSKKPISEYEAKAAALDAYAEDALVAQTEAVIKRMWNIAERAKEGGKLTPEIRAVSEVLPAVRLQAELTGRLQSAGTVEVTLNSVMFERGRAVPSGVPQGQLPAAQVSLEGFTEDFSSDSATSVESDTCE